MKTPWTKEQCVKKTCYILELHVHMLCTHEKGKVETYFHEKIYRGRKIVTDLERRYGETNALKIIDSKHLCQETSLMTNTTLHGQ